MRTLKARAPIGPLETILWRGAKAAPCASVEALRLAGFAPEVLNRLDRIFVFRPLAGLDIARVAALEIEAMIGGYGLEIAAGGIDGHNLPLPPGEWQMMAIGRSPRASGALNVQVQSFSAAKIARRHGCAGRTDARSGHRWPATATRSSWRCNQILARL